MAVEIHRAMQGSDNVYPLRVYPVENGMPPDIVTLIGCPCLSHMGAGEKREIGSDLNRPADFPGIFARLPLTEMRRCVTGDFFDISVRFC